MNIVYKGVAHPQLCDVMGHMTTRHYIAMFDDATYHFLFQVFGWSGSQAQSESLGWADVRHVIDYQAEVGEGDLLEIRAKLTKIGNKSTTAVYELYNLSRSEVAATLESTSVLFDMNSRGAIPLTAKMREDGNNFLREG